MCTLYQKPVVVTVVYYELELEEEKEATDHKLLNHLKFQLKEVVSRNNFSSLERRLKEIATDPGPPWIISPE